MICASSTESRADAGSAADTPPTLSFSERRIASAVTLLRDPEVAGFDFADRKRALVAKGLLRREVDIWFSRFLSLSLFSPSLFLSF